MVKANTVQGCINKNQECKKRNNFPIVLATGQSPARALFLVLGSTTTKKDMVNLEKVQRRTTKMIKGLKKKPKRKKI